MNLTIVKSVQKKAFWLSRKWPKLEAGRAGEAVAGGSGGGELSLLVGRGVERRGARAGMQITLVPNCSRDGRMAERI